MLQRVGRLPGAAAHHQRRAVHALHAGFGVPFQDKQQMKPLSDATYTPKTKSFPPELWTPSDASVPFERGPIFPADDGGTVPDGFWLSPTRCAGCRLSL